jgi:putative transposase
VGTRVKFILSSDAEWTVYLDLLRQYVQLHRLSLLAYCLMSNHVHLVVIPHQPADMTGGEAELHAPEPGTARAGSQLQN